MALWPDPDPPIPPPPLGPDRRLWLGLTAGAAFIALLAVAVHTYLPAPPPGPAPGAATLNEGEPLMSRPQLLENQQAMPELAGFDAQTPPPNPIGLSGPIDTSDAPSMLGSGVLGQ